MHYSANKNIRILIVDDNVENQLVISKLLGEDYEYVVVDAIASMLDYVRENCDELALVLVSMDMTQTNGLHAVNELSLSGFMDVLPVISYSNHPTEEKKNEAYDLGVADYINLSTKLQSAAKRVRNTINVYFRSRIRELNRADYDSLTGVYNLAGLRKKFEELVKNKPDSTYLVIYADIKSFRYFNKAYGFEEGNKLLRTWFDITERLTEDDAYLCRVTGDRMVVVINNPTDLSEYSKRAGIILDSLRKSCSEKYEEFTINIITGAYLYRPKDNKGERFDQIIGYARQAQKSLKNTKTSGFAFYDDKMWENQQRRMEINSRISKAIQTGEIMIYFQPQYNYVSGELIGAECLCRWNHKTLGMISPGEFIPALEETGKIYELDSYVWDLACQYMRKWLDEGYRISLAVNVSRKDIEHADLPVVFLNLVKKYKLEPDMLRIEITESVYMDDAEKFTNLIRQFSESGFSVEMDDFGSGFSSLNMLHNINVDVLKLDMGFLRDDDEKARSGSIINAIVKMAHTLDIKVLAEGVESLEQAEFLKNIGCLMAQGYFFSKPIPLIEFEALIRNSSLSEIKTNYNKYQVFNLAELFDRTSSGFFLFNNCMGPGALFDFDGKTLQPVIINDDFVEALALDRQIIEKHRADEFFLFSENNKENIRRLICSAICDGFAYGDIYSGRIDKYFRVFLRMIANRDNVNLIFCELTDVTKERKLEIKVSELLKEQQAQMEYIPSGTFKCAVSEEGRIVYASDSLAKLLGYPDTDTMLAERKNYMDIVYIADIERCEKLIRQQLAESDVTRLEHRVTRADGSVIWVFETGRCVEDEDGNKWAYVVISDIDTIKKEMLEKKRTEKKLNALFEIPGMFLYEYNPQNDTMVLSFRGEGGTVVSRTAQNYLEMLPKHNWIHPDYVDSYIETIKNVVRTGEGAVVTCRALAKGGSYILCNYYFIAIEEDDGSIYRVIGRAIQISETE